jgi:hypothetical protein
MTTIRNLPNLFFENDFVQNMIEAVRVSSNITNTYNRTEMSAMVSMALNKVPHDPNGIDAQLSFGMYNPESDIALQSTFFCPV